MASKVTQVAVIGIGSPPLPHPLFLGDQLVTFHGIQCPLIYRAIALLLEVQMEQKGNDPLYELVVCN